MHGGIRLRYSVVAVALLMVTGCSSAASTPTAQAPGSGGPTAAGPTVAAPTTASSPGNTDGITNKKILVALSSPESGAGSFAAAYTAGAKAYLTYVNEQGGVNGYTFDVAVVDNAGTAAGGAQAMRQIIQLKPAFTVITGSSSFQASVEIMKTDAPTLPVLGFGNAAVIGASGLVNAYGFFPDYVRECYFQAEFVVNTLKAKKVALVYEDSAIGQGPSQFCPAYLTKLGAVSKSYAVPPPTVSTNYTSIAAQIRDQSPDAALFFGSNTELVGIQKAAYAIGAKPAWIGLATSFDTTYFNLAGQAGEGTYFDAFAEPLTVASPEVTLYKQVMGRLAPNSANTLGGYGWSFGAILQLAVEKATTGGAPLSRETLIAAMNSIKVGQIGLLYSADYTGTDRSTIVNSLNIFQAKGGQFVEVVKSAPVPSR